MTPRSGRAATPLRWWTGVLAFAAWLGLDAASAAQESRGAVSTAGQSPASRPADAATGEDLEAAARQFRDAGERLEAIQCLVEAAEIHGALDSASDRARALGRVANALRDLAAFGEALRVFEGVLSIATQAPARDDEAVASALNDVAICLLRSGKPGEALPKFEEILEMRRRRVKGDHADTASSLNNLASCLRALKKYGDALLTFREALDMRRRLYKGDHPDVAMSLGNVALGLDALGKSPEARPLHEEALAMRQRLYKGDDLLVAASLNNLAGCLQSLRKPEEALPRFEEALQIRRRIHKGDHPDVAEGLDNLAGCLRVLKRYDEAVDKFREGLAMRWRVYGGDHPEVARSLGNLAGCLRAMGKENEALPLREAASEMRERLTKGDSLDAAAKLATRAGRLRNLGRNDESVAGFREALAMRRRLYTGDHAAVASSIVLLARCLDTLGRFEESLPLYEESLAMRRRLVKGDHPDVAWGLNNLANCLDTVGRSREGLPLHEEALAMRRRLFAGDHDSIASSLTNMASIVDDLGRTDDALALTEEALAMRRRLHRGDHASVARSLTDRGIYLDGQGRYREGLDSFNEALAMIQRVYKGDHEDVASCLTSMGVCLRALGRASEALVKHREALAMRGRLAMGDHPRAAGNLNNIAACNLALGKYEAAIDTYTEALAMLRRLFRGDHPEIARGVINLAMALRHLDREREALPLFEEALAMRQRLFPGDHPQVAWSLATLAGCLNDVGRVQEALTVGRSALAMQKRIFPSDYPNTAAILCTIAIDLKRLGRLDEALTTHEEALGMLERSFPLDHPEVLECLSHVGTLLCQREGDRARAEEVLLKTAVAFEMRCQALGGLTERAQLDYVRRLGWSNPYLQLCHLQAKRGALTRALDTSEARHARVFLDVAAQSSRDPLDEARAAALERGHAAIVEEIDGLRASIDVKSRSIHALEAERGRAVARSEPSNTGSLDKATELQTRLGVEIRAYNNALARRAALVRQYTTLAAPAKSEEIQATLEPSSVLLSYSLGSDESYCFVVPPAGGAVRAIPLTWPDGSNVTESSIEGLAVAYLTGLEAARGLAVRGGAARRAAASRRIPEKVTERGRELFEALVPKDLWTDVVKCTRVYVVPDGYLYWLPFESLITHAGPDLATSRYWLDDGPAIAYVPSGSALKVLRERRGRRESAKPALDVLAVGDPRLTPAQTGSRSAGAAAPPASESRPVRSEPTGRESLYRLDPLPHSRREVDAIDKALAKSRRVKTLVGSAANRSNVQLFAPQSRVLHFATHHVPYETDSESVSALLLSPAEDGSDDGTLRLRDVNALWRGRLTQCDLVVLAACGTSLGEFTRNEGMYAMPAGFFFAGAPAVVATLWPVADASTADLMAAFYTNWLGGAMPRATPLEALTAARKELRKAHPEPCYWAPFVYLGDPN